MSSTATSTQTFTTTGSSSRHRSKTETPQRRSSSRKPSKTGVPSRSGSSDLYPEVDIEYITISSNAFGVMNSWEVESLEKWQKRLDDSRYDQKILRARIEALRKEEEDMWAQSVRSRSYKSKPSRSASSSDSDSAQNSSQRSSRKSSRSTTTSVQDLEDWTQVLYAEVAGLQSQLAQCKEAEEKALRGIQKAKDRLARLEGLENGWKPPSTSSSPPRSRSKSPVPPQKPTRSNSSSSVPLNRRSSTSESSRPSKPRSYSTDAGIRNAVPKTLRPITTKAALDPWLSYEDRWHQLLTNTPDAPISLQFSAIPWPMVTQPSSPEDISASEIKAFLLSPRAIRTNLKLAPKTEGDSESRSATDEIKIRRALLRAAILRWHPDKFLTKFLGWVEDEDKVLVKEGVGKVIRCLNEIMRVEEIKSKIQ